MPGKRKKKEIATQGRETPRDATQIHSPSPTLQAIPVAGVATVAPRCHRASWRTRDRRSLRAKDMERSRERGKTGREGERESRSNDLSSTEHGNY